MEQQTGSKSGKEYVKVVYCHPAYLTYMQSKEVKWSCSVVSDPLRPCRLCSWDFAGKNTGVGCHFLLQGIFPTQGLNPGLLHCRQMLYHLSHQGSLMRNAGLDETQAGIKMAWRNINNHRYANDTTLRAESEEELNSLLI